MMIYWMPDMIHIYSERVLKNLFDDHQQTNLVSSHVEKFFNPRQEDIHRDQVTETKKNLNKTKLQ